MEESARHRPVQGEGLARPAGPYVPGMIFDRLVFVSGQGRPTPPRVSSPARTSKPRPSRC